MREIPLTRGLVAIVDDADYEALAAFKWYAARVKLKNSVRHYVCRRARNAVGKKIVVWMHRVLTKAPLGFVVDHINDNPLDNRRSNLRVVTHRENVLAGRHIQDRGVVFDKRFKKWVAQPKLDGKRRYFGCWPTRAAAIVAAQKARSEHADILARRPPPTSGVAKSPPEEQVLHPLKYPRLSHGQRRNP